MKYDIMSISLFFSLFIISHNEKRCSCCIFPLIIFWCT